MVRDDQKEDHRSHNRRAGTRISPPLSRAAGEWLDLQLMLRKIHD
jgi:hypothetical protein